MLQKRIEVINQYDKMKVISSYYEDETFKTKQNWNEFEELIFQSYVEQMNLKETNFEGSYIIESII